ncbi:phage tail terminator protein [Pasteurella bettyae]|uniref:phage tail terminator protein n=1 Tax=Pasteurella bettyae TaxID=752 RepID=UPI003D293BC3
MQDLKKIRKSVFDFLDGKIDGVDHYFCGHTVFLSAETELPAICVFIDDVQSDDSTICGAYWTGKLSVQVYLKSSLPEDDLDDLMELVINKLDGYASDELELLQLSAITYINDERQTEWIVGSIQYDISFYRKGAE